MKIRVFAVAFVAALILTTGFAEIASAQGRGGRGFLGGFDGGYLSLLRNDAVMNEIELVDDQREELDLIQEEIRQEMRERMEEMRNSDMSWDERREIFTEMREEMQERQGDLQKQVEEVLLPGQIKRLKQLEVQNNARRNGNGRMGALSSDSMLEELGVDEKQKKKLEEKAAELKKKLQEKIKKLTSDAEEELLSVLSSEQRKKFMEKFGPAYEFGSDFDRRGRRGGRDRGDRERRGDNDF